MLCQCKRMEQNFGFLCAHRMVARLMKARSRRSEPDLTVYEIV